VIKSVILIDVKPVEFNDDGELNTKYKHLFLDEKNACLVGWADHPMDAEVVNSASYDRARARDVEVRMDEFQGKLRYRVVIP